MEMEIKGKFWVLDESGKRKIINDEKEAIASLKDLMKKDKEPSLLEMEFKGEQIEYRQVSWEKIARGLIKNEK